MTREKLKNITPICIGKDEGGTENLSHIDVWKDKGRTEKHYPYLHRERQGKNCKTLHIFIQGRQGDN